MVDILKVLLLIVVGDVSLVLNVVLEVRIFWLLMFFFFESVLLMILIVFFWVREINLFVVVVML